MKTAASRFSLVRSKRSERGRRNHRRGAIFFCKFVARNWLLTNKKSEVAQEMPFLRSSLNDASHTHTFSFSSIISIIIMQEAWAVRAFELSHKKGGTTFEDFPFYGPGFDAVLSSASVVASSEALPEWQTGGEGGRKNCRPLNGWYLHCADHSPLLSWGVKPQPDWSIQGGRAGNVGDLIEFLL